VGSYFDSPEAKAAIAKHEEYLRQSRLRHKDYLRRRDNPVRPEDFEKACGPGHRVQLSMVTWKGQTIECENCGCVMAGWQEKFKGKKKKDDPFLDLKMGWVLTSAAEAPCSGQGASDG
jgi:hypothetical protein